MDENKAEPYIRVGRRRGTGGTTVQIAIDINVDSNATLDVDVKSLGDAMDEAARVVTGGMSFSGSGTTDPEVPKGPIVVPKGPTSTIPLLSRLNGLHALADVRPDVKGFEPEALRSVADALLVLMEGFYAHRELKLARYGIDPVPRLRRLLEELEEPSPQTDELELRRILLDLRDRHVVVLDSRRSEVAYLPFVIERITNGKVDRYVIRHVADEAKEDGLAGATVTHWNGMPIQRAIDENATYEGGGNRAARFARGLERLTTRPLATSLTPREDWVRLGYERNGKSYTADYEWKVAIGLYRPNATPTTDMKLVGVDTQAQLCQLARKTKFAAESQSFQMRMVGSAFMCLRIHDFNAGESLMSFCKGLAAEVSKASGQPLIVDVRDNPGGSIQAAEFLLQLLSPQRDSIRRVNFQFVLNSATAELAPRLGLQAWSPSQWRGGPYSPLAPLPQVEGVDQIEPPSKVLLIANALSYSATDILAAEWMDSHLGPILLTDDNTGGGGGAIFKLREIVGVLDEKTRNRDLLALRALASELPSGIDVQIPVLRALRTGAGSNGLPIEDIGLGSPNGTGLVSRYNMQPSDVSGINVSLLAEASKILKAWEGSPRR